ncbi:MAG TPA: hypothetical protein RMH99_06230 [Sandaracinaceae bacterium LLY-WYZ-13_1]|nr:hypothetical protein [Sandaracinaceae bacterium LLY-WYZ-13_1]
MSLTLRVRTPEGLAFDGPVDAIRAEDADGWFGILPGRRDVVAVLPPGLLLFEDAEGDGFVALSGGLLELTRDRCRVVVREARVAREAEAAADALDTLIEARRARIEHRRGVMEDLEREALRRLARALEEAQR